MHFNRVKEGKFVLCKRSENQKYFNQILGSVTFILFLCLSMPKQARLGTKERELRLEDIF